LTPTKLVAAAVAVAALLAPAAAQAAAHDPVVPLAAQVPERAFTTAGATGTPYCTTPPPVVRATYYHCYTPQDVLGAYGVDALHQQGNLGKGQTIVLVDAYGTPAGQSDLQTFHDTFFPGLPKPDYEAYYPNGAPDFKAATGNGQSGPSAAAGWAGEATLDIEWAYAMAPLAHIVLVGVPPAETEGVQGLPNLFKAISALVDREPPGTVFSQSFGITEETFGGAAKAQTAKFDAVYQKAAAKGDTILASSGDDGTTGVAKQQKDSVTYDHPTVGWPASSPYVTAVGGTQLQSGWTWNPTSDTPFTADGAFNPDYFASTQSGFSEAAWNESWLPAATGGGPSVIYPRPSYQDGVASRITSTSGAAVNARGVPDVAWNAAVNGGVLVYTSYFPDANRVGWHVYGGTSASSPQVAGLVALANEQQAGAGGKPLGFLNPLLYGVGTGAQAATAFRDIVPATYGTTPSGHITDNRLWSEVDGQPVSPGPIAGHPVGTGWDETTGFGVPRAGGFVAALRAARNATP
jgi:subtilase family serine protease